MTAEWLSLAIIYAEINARHANLYGERMGTKLKWIKPMKRNQVTDVMVCAAYQKNRERPSEWATQRLARETGAPEKVCLRACERALSHGLIECGVSLRSGWLTAKGIELLKTK